MGVQLKWAGFWLLLVLPCFSSAQDSYSWTQDSVTQIYGADDYLFTGYPYQPMYRGATGHPYFLQEPWLQATIFIENIPFPDQVVRLNLVTEELIILHSPEGKAPVQLVLSNHLIDSFFVNQTKLISLDVTNGMGLPKGYFEVLYQGNFSVLRKASRDFLANYNAATPKGSFSEVNATYYVKKDGSEEWSQYSSFKALIKSFPDQYKAIRKVMKQEGISKKMPSASACQSLLELCDE